MQEFYKKEKAEYDKANKKSSSPAHHLVDDRVNFIFSDIYYW